ncbi:MAG: D-alanyl-D-alanine carboxypeptidase family protein [Aristaeellaceae bacterium]
MNWKKWIGLTVAGILLVATVVLGVRVAGLVQLTQVEMNRTPTPNPAYGNVMAVTIDPNEPTPAPVIRHGAQGEEVKALQARLQTLGYYQGEIDGQFGNGTRAAVILFQQQHGLDADGVVGEATRAVLYSTDAHPIVVTATPAPTSTPAPTDPTTPGISANGMPLLVNRQHLLPEDYQTVDLVNMYDYCDSSVVTIKGNGIAGERIAVDALMTMLRAAISDGISPWQVSAGYRTVAYQQKLFDNQVYEYMQNGLSRANATSATRKTVADPGSSEHHLGLAFDITVPGVAFKGTRQAQWMAEHCWEYGFILRYTEDKEDVTGFLAEPWHFRYVGVEHSLIMREENLCLEEYLDKYSN